MRQIPKHRVGRIQRRIARAFITSGGTPLLTTHLLEYAYPRLDRYQHWHYKSVYVAARKFAIRVSRPGRAVVIWAPNDALMARIKGDSVG